MALSARLRIGRYEAILTLGKQLLQVTKKTFLDVHHTQIADFAAPAGRKFGAQPSISAARAARRARSPATSRVQFSRRCRSVRSSLSHVSSGAIGSPAPEQRPQPVADVVAEDLGEDICLYRATDEVLVLNQTAADIWRLCDGESSVPQIIQTLADAYQTPRDAVRSDIDTVITDLLERGYLRTDPIT
jgi:hypothetical protein